jgi:hypothetical protein
MRMNKVLALVVAAAMGLSSAAFAAETTATAAPLPLLLQPPPLRQQKRFTIRNTAPAVKPLHQQPQHQPSRKLRLLKSTTKKPLNRL